MRSRRVQILLIMFITLYISNLIIENNSAFNKNNDNEFFTYNKNRMNPSSSSPPLKYEWVYNWDSGVDDYYGDIEIDSGEYVYICVNNYLLKLNSFGVQLWNKTIPDIDYYAKDMILDSKKNILIVGRTSGSMDTKLFKFNSTGDLQWSQTSETRDIGNFELNLAIDSLDNIYVGSDIQNVGAGYADIYLAKYNSTGGLIWETWWGTPIFDLCYDITIDSSGNIYLAGFNQIIGTTTKNIILVKFNNLGDFIWNREWNRNNLDESHAVGIDSLGNIWLGGFTRITGSNHDFVLLKYDPFGALLLDEIWGTNNDEKCFALDIDSQNNIYLSGNYIVKFDIFGIKKWDFSFSTIDLIKSREIKLDNYGNLFLYGSSSSSTLDVCLVKTNLLPRIMINFPILNNLFGNSTLEFNITIDEPFLNSTWYNLNSGQNHTFSGTTGLIDQAAWDLCGNGTVTIRFYANNTWSHEGYQEIVIRKDNIAPNISILSPEPNQLFGNATFGFNLSIIESNLDTVWYSLNGGKNYIFSGSNGTIEQTAWDSCGNGTVAIRFYANDTVGNIGIEEIIVRKDQNLPEIIIYFPIPYQLFGNETIGFELFLNKPYLNSTWYSLNGGKNYTFSGSTGIIEQAAWDVCGNGTVAIRFYANDTNGELSYEEIIVRKDIHIPIITIYNPSPNQFFSNSSPTFNLFIEDPILNSTWYTLNRTMKKYGFTGFSGEINQTAWAQFGNGQIIIEFYANNSLGNLASKEIIIFKDNFLPEIQINLPLDNQIYGIISPDYNVSINEPNLDTSWYTLNGSIEKYEFVGTTGKIDQTAWELYGNGTISIQFYANDSAGNLAYNEVIFHKDIILPEITIKAPIPNQLFGNRTFNFDLSIFEPNLLKTWYSLNNGLNYSFTGMSGKINRTAWDLCENGTVMLKFYAEDHAGNIAIKQVIVRKDINLITYIDLTGTPIFIDDANVNYNWQKTAKDNEWCSGSGTWIDPYIIEYVIIDGQNSDNCIYIANSHVNFIIRGCILNNSGSSNSGIKLVSTHNGSIINNFINYNGYGISFDTSNDNIIEGNIFNAFQTSAIYLYNSDNNLIFQNRINESNYAGIYLIDGSDSNIISGNNITNIDTYGIIISGSSPKPQDNLIFRNNFTNNSQHATISILDSKTKWDNGSIGNYWDDYSGFDLDGDDIGDKPYYIDTVYDEKDRFPIWPGDDYTFEWLKTKDYGIWGLSDIGKAIAIDDDGYIYVTGTITVTNDNIVLLKYNSLGELLWQREWAGGMMDGANGITTDIFGNIYIVGYTETSTNNEDILLIKYDNNGLLQWAQTWDGGLRDGAEGITIDSFGDIYITGYTQTNTPNLYNMILIKYNITGSYQWNKIWTYSSQSFGKSIAIDPSGNVFITGFYYGGAGSNMFVVKYDNIGNYKWETRWGIRHYSFGTDLAFDSEGNLFVSGSTYYSGESSDLCFWKIEGQGGNPIYYRIYDRSSDNDANAIAIDSSDNVFLLGSIGNDFLGTNKIYLVNYDKNGDFQYYEQWGDNLDDIGYGIALNNYDTIYVCGTTESYAANGIDIFILKYLKFPESPYISINNGAESTNSTLVDLTLSALYAEEMCFKNGTSGSWSIWEPYKIMKHIYLENSINNTNYTISVKFRNLKGETVSLNDSILLIYYFPESVAININNGAQSTNSTLISLTISALYADEMCFRVGVAGTWTSWEPYQITKILDIPNPQNNTIYTIYVKFRNSFGESIPISDDILYLLNENDLDNPKSKEPSISSGIYFLFTIMTTLGFLIISIKKRLLRN